MKDKIAVICFAVFYNTTRMEGGGGETEGELKHQIFYSEHRCVHKKCYQMSSDKCKCL